MVQISISSRNLDSLADSGRFGGYRKGISASAHPYKRTAPTWLKISSQDVSFSCLVFCDLVDCDVGFVLVFLVVFYFVFFGDGSRGFRLKRTSASFQRRG